MDKNKVYEYIDSSREDMISSLMELIESPSPDLEETQAQEIVLDSLKEMGFETEAFRGDLERVSTLPDYCDPGAEFREGIYNVAGVRKSTGGSPSLMLFAHIDTRPSVYGEFRDGKVVAQRRGGKIYGLGAADDKGGVAMMLEAVRTALHFRPDLGYDLTVMSILGKRGGAFGTLSALTKGYTANSTLYIHPAETGHGFREIKNISLGVIDLKLTVDGVPGIPHDDLSEGINANRVMAEAVCCLQEYSDSMKKTQTFPEGTFKGQPSYGISINSVQGSALKAECTVRCRFYHPLSADTAEEGIRGQLESLFSSRYPGAGWKLERAGITAMPAETPEDSRIVKVTTDSIRDVCGPVEFIYQYHGGSDVRFPILYGNSETFGIGPSCGLPSGPGEEWIDEEDYITGIKILTTVLLYWNE